MSLWRGPAMRGLVLTLELEPVQEALRLGWKLPPGSYRKRAHFYFDGPTPFSVHWKWGQVGYTVGHDTIFSTERAIASLRIAAESARPPERRHLSFRRRDEGDELP
jgi:hypothetical protein